MKINIFTTKLKLTILILLSLLILKLFVIKDIVLILKTTIYDIIVCFLIFLIFLKTKNKILNVLFYFVSFLNLFILSTYYYYFYSVYQRMISLSDVSFELILFLFEYIISLKYIISIIFIILILFIISKYLFLSKKIFSNKKDLTYLLFFSIFLFLVLSIINFSYNPYKDLFFKFNKKAILLDDTNKDINLNFFNEDKSIASYKKEILKYNKILVFVGEEWMFSEFMLEKEDLENNFFKKIENNSHMFTNYFTTNQDSRTAIFTMLSSNFIPFEAYSDKEIYNKYYSKIITKNNLVEFFNHNNYSTQFLVSAIEIPDLTYPYNWNKVNLLSQEIYDNKKYYCDDSFSFETSCEDLSVIDDLEKIILENDKLFLFQEFIFGHSFSHIINTKKTRTEYYNNYFLKIFNFLEKKDLLDQTIIIITSDHGSRALKEMQNYTAYNVPLIIIASDLNYFQDASLLSHLDFKDILFNYILKDYNKKIINDSVMFVGSSKSNLFGYFTNKNDFGIINSSKNKLINYSNNDDIKNISNKYNIYYKYIIDNYE
jgi:hypothetical protein